MASDFRDHSGQSTELSPSGLRVRIAENGDTERFDNTGSIYHPGMGGIIITVQLDHRVHGR